MYADLGEEVKHEIEETKKEIDSSKSLLEEATKHRKHSMEYDALAKLIESKPDRKITDGKRQEIETDLLLITVSYSMDNYYYYQSVLPIHASSCALY